MEKKYNLSVSPFWVSENSITGIVIDDEIFDKLQRVEKGGKLLLRFRADSKCFNEEDRRYMKETLGSLKDFFMDRLGSTKSNHAYLEYMSKEDVERFAKTAKRGQSKADQDDGVI